MSYGLTVDNMFGRAQIDTSTRQIEIVKEGDTLPHPIGRLLGSEYTTGNTRRKDSSVNQPVILPYSGSTTTEPVIFIKPQHNSGSSTSGVRLRVGVKGGKVTYKWKAVTNGTYPNTNGQQFVYATPIVGTPSINSAHSHPGYGYSTIIDHQYTKDSVGNTVGNLYTGWASYVASTGGTPKIAKIEYVTGAIYKVYMEPNGTGHTGITNSGGMPNNTQTTTSTMSCVWFHSPNDQHYAELETGSEHTGYTLAYRVGYFTGLNTLDNASGYGLEVYNISGQCTWSSERVNFQIESMSEGQIAVERDSGLPGRFTNTPAVNPVIHHKFFDQSNQDDYWVVVTTRGPQSVYIKGYSNTSPSIPRRSVSFAAGWTFNYNLTSFSNLNGSGQAAEESVTNDRPVRTPNTNYKGVSLSPFEEAFRKTTPSSSRSQTWYSPKSGALIIGKMY